MSYAWETLCPHDSLPYYIQWRFLSVNEQLLIPTTYVLMPILCFIIQHYIYDTLDLVILFYSPY